MKLGSQLEKMTLKDRTAENSTAEIASIEVDLSLDSDQGRDSPQSESGFLATDFSDKFLSQNEPVLLTDLFSILDLQRTTTSVTLRELRLVNSGL